MAANPRSIVMGLLIAIVSLGLTFALVHQSFFALLDLKSLDLFFILRGPLAEPANIVIVAIDEPSFADLGRQWPWPRSLHGQLIRQLDKAGAKVIAFDILFAEPSQPDEDHALAQALREAGNGVLVSESTVIDDPAFRQTILAEPIPELREAAAVGISSLAVDFDGTVRRVRFPSPAAPDFITQIVGLYRGEQTPVLFMPEGGQSGNGWNLAHEVLINYLGPARTIKTVSYYQALDYEHLLPPGIFAGRIVLVGRSLEATPEPQRLSSDNFLTPFSLGMAGPISGVEIQATLIDNLLQDSFIRVSGKALQSGLLSVFLLASSLLVIRLKPMSALLATLFLAGLWFALTYLAFIKMNLWLPVVSGVMGIGLVYIGYLLLHALAAERERRQLLEQANRDLEIKITERTQELSIAHQELGQRHRQLENAYQELTRAQQQLVHSEKMASLGLLVAGVAHELNNPISFVHGNLEFIGEYTDRLATVIDAYSGAGRDDPPSRRAGDRQKEKARVGNTLKTLRELIASCREGTERVKKIVLDLRTFSRADDTGPVLAELHEGLESTLNLLVKEYRDRITVHRDYAKLPAMECYSGQINQVFMNLLLNAAQAIPEKGDVWIQTALEDDRVIITIRDNGNGIPESNLHRIFDPFFTTKPVGTGTGLGLSITYSIIDKHGGTIRVKSQVNVGTEFTVELPLRLHRKEYETLRVAASR
ncbi:MAG: CHASE2 domain-containing protein [Candidatus Competibacteraceae bacterium]